MSESDTGQAATVPVWDPWLRLFHWSLVAVFTVAWLTAEENETLHEAAGYIVAGLIAFRLVWGFAGPRYVRFSQFVRGPLATLTYMGDAVRGRAQRYLGPNPAGAAMVLALLVTLSGTALTGWLYEQSAEKARAALPVAARAGSHVEDSHALEGAHEALANLALILVILHVGGVAFSSWRQRENLPRAMIHGRKRAPGAGDVA